MTSPSHMEGGGLGANAVPAPRHSGSAPSPSVSAIRRVSAFATATYANDSYEMTPEDFADGCFIRVVNGRAYGTGRTVIGDMRTVPLNVPLCSGCDKIIVDHICPDCELEFVTDPLKAIADGRKAAA